MLYQHFYPHISCLVNFDGYFQGWSLRISQQNYVVVISNQNYNSCTRDPLGIPPFFSFTIWRALVCTKVMWNINDFIPPLAPDRKKGTQSFQYLNGIQDCILTLLSYLSTPFTFAPCLLIRDWQIRKNEESTIISYRAYTLLSSLSHNLYSPTLVI